jgi:hypothetical protein
MEQMLPLLQRKKLMAQFAQCVQAMLVLRNVKHVSKPFAY